MVLALCALVVIAVVVVAAAAGPATRRSRGDDTERFHRAASLTSQWARSGISHPVHMSEPEERVDA